MDEQSPYLSETTLNSQTSDSYFSQFSKKYMFWAGGIVVLVCLIIVLLYVYKINLSSTATKEPFLNYSKRSDSQVANGYLDAQINLLNRLQHKNMSK